MVRNRAFVAMTALSIGSSAAGAFAQTAPTTMYGSDTLRDVTQAAIAACVSAGKLAANNIFYLGGGSGEGGRAMGAGGGLGAAQSQQIAPQSRFLSSTECSAIGTNQGTGMTIGLDGLAIVAASGNNCDVLKYTGAAVPDAPGFAFSDWRDVLRVVYTGQLSKVVDSGTDGCNLADPAATPSAPGSITDALFNGVADTRGVATNASTATRCDNPVRKYLIAQWPRMFKDTCTNGTCGPLRHAWRRDDVSGTTDTFLTLLGLPKPPSSPTSAVRSFCNGLDTEDLDPLRTACDANEDVCASIPYANRNTNPNGSAPATGQSATGPSARGGDLGLVQAITMPTDTAKQFGAACTFGKFAFAPMPAAGPLEAQRCPDGNGRSAGRCKYPYTGNNPPPVGSFNCFAAAGTQPSPRVWTNMDGRAYNLIPRDPATGAIIITPSAPGIADPRWGGGGVYRIHQAKAMANSPIATGFAGCKKTDATQQIGCLTAADPCTIGYAGLEALEQPSTKSLVLRSPNSAAPVEVAATEPNVLKLLDACPSVGTRYPLSRRLWINSSKGLANVVNAPTPGLNEKNELDFLSCVSDRGNGIIDNAITANKFIKVPASFTTYPTRTCP